MQRKPVETGGGGTSRTEEKKKSNAGGFSAGARRDQVHGAAATRGCSRRSRPAGRLLRGTAAPTGPTAPNANVGAAAGVRLVAASPCGPPQRGERRQRMRGREAGGEGERGRRKFTATGKSGNSAGEAKRGAREKRRRRPSPGAAAAPPALRAGCRCPEELRGDPRRSAPRRAPIVRRGQSAPALPAAANRLRGPRGEVSAAPTAPPPPPAPAAGAR